MDNFEKMLHEMFDHIWDCEIDHPIFQDTVGDLMKAVIAAQQLQYEEKRERLQLLEVAEAAPQEQSSGAAAQESGEPSADEGTGLNPTQEAQSETRAETAPEPVKKKGLLNRLFGRR